MVTKIVMPKLSLTMKEGTVGVWYKKEGDTVEKGELLVEVFSEKATHDLESPSSGMLRKILVQEGLDAPINALLAIITGPDEEFDEKEILAVESEPASKIEKKVLASPAAKRLAREHGMNLSLVEGSGPDGRIVEDDVRIAIEKARGILPKVREVIPLSGYQKVSADRVSASFRTAPHSTVFMEVDVSQAKNLQEEFQVSYTSIFVKAAAESLREYPMVNSTFEGDRIKIYGDVNVGVAVATEDGLVVPVLHNADRRSLKEIDSAIKELTRKSRAAKLTRDDLSGGTFTVTNLGMYGVEFFIPIINPPEAAILAVGRVVEKPVVIDEEIKVKPMVKVSLSYDHRIVDGAPASEFLRKIKERIEKENLK